MSVNDRVLPANSSTNLHKYRFVIGLASVVAVSSMMPSYGMSQDATFIVKQLTTETALTAAQAALGACRKQGFQVAVVVTDRSGLPQAFLRDRFAGPHTIDAAINKAWTAASFRMDSQRLSDVTAKPENAGARHLERVVALGGGVPIEAAGSMFGAIGVSGSSSGKDDDQCARAGIAEIMDALEF